MAKRRSSDPEVRAARDKIELKPGMKVNKLTLIRKEGANWVCDCDCGTKGVVITRAYRLKNELIGDVQDHVGSCGCLQKKIFKSANRQGTIETKYQDYTINGLKILYRTDYINHNRSTIVMAECPLCQSPFPTPVNNGTHCGCAQGRQPLSLEDYLLKSCCKSYDEQQIYNMLTDNNIPFIYDKVFQKCIDKGYLPFDFYIDNKYIVEFDGEQHFRDIGFFKFNLIRRHDFIKNQYCFANNIPIIRIPYYANYTLDDLKLETTRYLLTPENEKQYYQLT